MDPLGAPLSADDLQAPDFPFPDAINVVMVDREAQAPALESLDVPDDEDDYMIGANWKPTMAKPLHSVRCTAIKRSDGKRCTQWSVIGFSKCRKHSGYKKLPHLEQYREEVIARARLDLLRMTPYAVDALDEIVNNREINPATRLKASIEILDRVGIRGGTEMTVNAQITQSTPAEEVRARLQRLSQPAGELASSARAALPSARAAQNVSETEIIDAELVTDEENDLLRRTVTVAFDELSRMDDEELFG
jgi:hypothetical protein